MVYFECSDPEVYVSKPECVVPPQSQNSVIPKLLIQIFVVFVILLVTVVVVFTCYWLKIMTPIFLCVYLLLRLLFCLFCFNECIFYVLVSFVRYYWVVREKGF